MPHRKRGMRLLDVAMGRVWIRALPRARTIVIGSPAYRKAVAAVMEKEKLAQFMDSNLGVAYVMSGSQTGKTTGEDVVRAFARVHLEPGPLGLTSLANWLGMPARTAPENLKHLEPRTLAPGEMLQEGQCVGCPVPPEKHEPGCSIDCLGPETHGPRIETMDEPINTCSAAPSPDKAREQTIEEMCMTWKEAMPLHNAPDVVNNHIRNLMTKVYEHSVAPRQQRIDRMSADESNRRTRLSTNYSTMQAAYRELFGKLNQACKRLDIATPNNLQDAVASIKAITDHALRLRSEVKIGHEAFNRAKGWPVDLPVMTTLFDKPLEYWQELDELFKVVAAERDNVREKLATTEAHRNQLLETVTHLSATGAAQRAGLAELKASPPQSADARLLIHVGELRMATERVTAQLKLKPGTPIEVILDTIESIQQHAEKYRTHNRTLANGDRLISVDEYERLLAIERGHQQDKTTARLAAQENHSLREQMNLIGAALKRAGIEHPKGVWHIGVCDLATRYTQLQEEAQLAHKKNTLLGERYDEVDKGWLQERYHHQEANKQLDAIRQHLCLPNGGIDDVLREIARLQEATKPIYGESPLVKLIPIYHALTKITDQLGLTVVNAHANAPELLAQAICEEVQKLQKGQMQKAYMEKAQENEELMQEISMIARAIDSAYPVDNFTLTETCRNIHQGIRSLKQAAAAHRSDTLKIATLRNIVLRKAPHVRKCMPLNHQPCNCWKSEFMAEADSIPEDATTATEACPATHEAPTMMDCMRCGQEKCHLRYGEPNGQPYTAKGTIE